MSWPQISGDRLLADLAALSRFGGRPDGGVDRVAGSEADLAARRWLADQITEAGLSARQDLTGNVFGRTRASTGPWLLAGSHSDSVPAGGRLDGAYGVLAALEVLRTLHQAGHPAAEQFEVVSFWDEEGARPESDGGLVGSRALCGDPHLADLSGFLELHVEQGPRMESQGLELAVVEGIVAVERYEVTITGAANHAGTTPWPERRDAGLVATEIASQVRRVVQQADPAMVGNVGCLELRPGSPNVVPGWARLVVELRAAESARLAAVVGQLQELAQHTADREQCAVQFTRLSQAPAASFDADYCRLLEKACRESGRATGRLRSYAGHDAGVLSRHIPTAMLFVPSTGGVSHSPSEHTPDELLIAGCQALLAGVIAILAATEPSTGNGRRPVNHVPASAYPVGAPPAPVGRPVAGTRLVERGTAMTSPSPRRSLLSISDLDDAELAQIVERSAEYATGASTSHQPLSGCVVGIYFRRTSTRTRTAFSTGALRLGAQIVTFGPDDLQLNTGETMADTGRVFAGMLDGLVARTCGSMAELRELATDPRLPVVNAMAELEHPTQAITDLSTLTAHFGSLAGLRVLYVGEGNNTATALALALTRYPKAELHLFTPPGYGIDRSIAATAAEQARRTGAVFVESHDMDSAPAEVDVVYTTRWQTTGTTKPDPNWRTVFAPFQVNEAMMRGYPSAVFLHDLPAHRGEEVTAEVLDGPVSLAFEQANHKLYGAMAVLEWCVAGW